jgi:hypothetical protein
MNNGLYERGQGDDKKTAWAAAPKTYPSDMFTAQEHRAPSLRIALQMP